MSANEPIWRQALGAELDFEQSRAYELRASLDALVDKRQSESDDDEHDPDADSLSSQWSMLTGLLESTNEQIREIDAALARLERGTFGICERCGKPIPEGQLMARPFRARCVQCSSTRP